MAILQLRDWEIWVLKLVADYEFWNSVELAIQLPN